MENLTLDWSDDQRIKKIPLYSKKLMGRYLKSWPSYTRADWDTFKEGLLNEFKEDDAEQQRNIKTYLNGLVYEMRKEQSPLAGQSQAFFKKNAFGVLSVGTLIMPGTQTED